MTGTGVFSRASGSFFFSAIYWGSSYGKDKHIVSGLHQAVWHTAKEVEVPEGIHLDSLSSRSPELQPVERRWPLTNEGVANRFFEAIEELEASLVERCVALCGQQKIIRSYTRYHWWPQAV
jgi:hypothetical protein